LVRVTGREKCYGREGIGEEVRGREEVIGRGEGKG